MRSLTASIDPQGRPPRSLRQRRIVGERGTAYNITDDEPVSMPALLTAMAAAVGAPRPWAVPAWLLAATPFAKTIVTGGLRVGNAKAKAELGWTLQASTYRDGLRLMTDHGADQQANWSPRSCACLLVRVSRARVA